MVFMTRKIQLQCLWISSRRTITCGEKPTAQSAEIGNKRKLYNWIKKIFNNRIIQTKVNDAL